jgi:hypothetical protein
MKTAFLSLLVLGLFFVPGHIDSASVPGIGQRFLDLPDGFGVSEEDEDIPELIEFYADEYEGDAFFFCLDKSDSMGETAAGGRKKWQVRNDETIKAISGMTKRSVACVVFFDFKKLQSDTYGDPPIRMDAAGKAQLIGQISQVDRAHHDGSDSCICEGMMRTFQVANKTQNSYRVCFLLADGRAQCDGGETDPDRVFQRIMSANIHRIPINTIYTGQQQGTDWERGKPVLERLAQATGGKFKIAS